MLRLLFAALLLLGDAVPAPAISTDICALSCRAGEESCSYNEANFCPAPAAAPMVQPGARDIFSEYRSPPANSVKKDDSKKESERLMRLSNTL
jgi:hypothetical protein